MPTLPLMPVLFVGHGSPMNITDQNSYTESLKKIAGEIPLPKAVIVFSAHWITQGIFITGGARPQQIYDFYGFPEELYNIIYSPPGFPELSESISAKASMCPIKISRERGFDHGAWAVLRHIYPKADIPLLQISLDYEESALFHYELGRSLSYLREQGVLIIGSGNLVHNLREISWNRDEVPHAWVLEFDREIRDALLKRDVEKMLNFQRWGELFFQAHPTHEHYLPLLPILGLQNPQEKVEFFHESIQNLSVSMRSFIIK